MRKYVVTLWVMMLLLAFPLGNAIAAQAITVTLDGEKLNFDVSPVLENGRVLVPLRPLFEALGKEVNWEAKNKSITTRTKIGLESGPTNIVSLAVGHKVAYLDDRMVKLDVPPKIINGRTLIPVRFAAEALGTEVNWDSQTSTVVIKDKQRYYDKVMEYLKSGDLASARRVAISAPVKYPFQELSYLGEASSGYTYFFPEGEAGRYYYWRGDLFTYVEATNRVYTVAWQARISDSDKGRVLEKNDTFSRWRNNYTRILKEELGERPIIEKPLMFFNYHPTVVSLRYGRIDPDGTETVLGSAEKVKVTTIEGEKPIFPGNDK